MINTNTSDLISDQASLHSALANTASPLVLLKNNNQLIGFTGDIEQTPSEFEPLALLPAIAPETLGDVSFCRDYGVGMAYMTGAMANGIASAELVIAIGKNGLLGSYGAGGVLPEKVEADVQRIKSALGEQKFAVNLIHSPHEQRMEQRCVEILLKHKVDIIEASAFMGLTEHLVYYRLAGVYRDQQGVVRSRNRVIGKVSRPEVAERFMSPAPYELVKQLLSAGKINQAQAQLAKQLPIADDVIAEADSGGHTDRRPLTVLLPNIIDLRDRIQSQYQYPFLIRVGAAGGIGSPEAASAAFAMGAAFIVTGSINQGCVESSSSDHVRKLLQQADFADVDMAPAADMFEMGVELQVLKRGTLFPMRARWLYELYQQYNSLEDIPAEATKKLEAQVFKRPLTQVWQETADFFNKRDPGQISRAENDPKRKMALVFRSYLGQSSGWANNGVADRMMDYQIWTGPAMGAFNNWVKNTYLEKVENRRVADVAEHIMRGCAYVQRMQILRLQGVSLPVALAQYPLQAIAREAKNAA